MNTFITETMYPKRGGDFIRAQLQSQLCTMLEYKKGGFRWKIMSAHEIQKTIVDRT